MIKDQSGSAGQRSKGETSRGAQHESADTCVRFLCSLLNPFRGGKSWRDAGTRSPPDSFTNMERFFLALMVSGLLLAVAAASLFVIAGADDRTTSAVNLPSRSNTYLQKTKPREVNDTVGRH